MSKLLSAIVCAFLAPVLLWSQSQPVIDVTEEQAADHRLKAAEPEYPAFARVAGIEGTVSLCTQISADGHVQSMFPVIGPPSLEQVAANSLQQSLYKPFLLNGKPTAVRAWVKVRFQLPPGTVAHTYPTPKLSFKSYYPYKTRDSLSVEFSSLPPGLRRWFRKALADEIDGSLPPPERDLAVESAIHATDVWAIPGNERGSRLYLFETKSEQMCGATGNCTWTLAEQRGSAFTLAAEANGWGFALYQRPDSPYPDVLFISHMSAFEASIEGYGKAGGLWGQLYADMLGKRPDGEPPNPFLCKP